MSRSVWGTTVECIGFGPALVGSIAGGIWSTIQGDGFENGMDDGSAPVEKVVNQIADLADAHNDQINNALMSLAKGTMALVAARLVGDRADEWIRRNF